MSKSRLIACLLVSAAMYPVAAYAQTAPDQGNAEASRAEAREGDEIIVSARRREERFVDAPVSVSVATSEDLQTSGVTGTRDLQLITPNLNVTLFGPFVQPSIRGIGSSGIGPGAEANVALYIDGVYQASQIAALLEFDNIEVIETLKGPQGALYGRNATGGAIVITTKAPSLAATTMNASVSYGSDQEIRASGYVNLAVSDQLAANLAIYRKINDGYVTNVVSGAKASVSDSFGIRGRILFEPTPGLRFTLSGAHIDQKDNTALSVTPLNGNSVARGTQGETFGRTDHSRIAHNIPPQTTLTYDAISLNVDIEGGWGKLTSISSWAGSNAPFQLDQDGTELPILSTSVTRNEQDTWAQELIYTSPSGRPFTWLAGLYYLRDKSSADFFVCAGAFCPTAFYPLTPSVLQNTKAWSAYAEGELAIGDRLHLTVGGRYSDERKDAQYRNGIGGLLMMDGSNSWGSFTPHAALRYDLTSVSSAYLSYSQGFKSGLFDSLNTGTCVNTTTRANCPSPGTPVNPEKVKAFEAGYKYNSGGTSISVAAFYNDYTGIQITGRDAIGNLILFNAATAETYGVEMEFNTRLTDNFTVRGGAGYTHGEYTSFASASDFAPKPTGGNSKVVIDATGNKMVRTPEFTAMLALNYSQPISSGRIEASAVGSYSSSYFWDPSNRVSQPKAAVVNAQLGWVSESNHLRITGFVNNLTNKERMTYVRISDTGDLVSYSRPRTWGVRLGFDF